MAKVAAAFLHVVEDDGRTVVLRPGQEVPAHLEDQVTNPSAYFEVLPEDGPADPGPDPSTTPLAINGELVDVEEIIETAEDGTPLVVRVDGEILDLRPKGEPETPPATPEETPADGTPEETPADSAPAEPAPSYLDALSYRELQGEAEKRDIAQNGSTAALLARIKEHDAAHPATSE